MNLKFVPICLLTLASFNLFAQSEVHYHNESDHPDHSKNEIGIANSPVYFVKEKIWAYGLHVHYVRSLSDTKFGVGLGYERIFDQHKHNTFGLIGSYRPIEPLSFSISPGITFEDEDPKANFAFHFETSYEFEVRNLHVGPVLEFAFDPEDVHISLGLHIGFGFWG